MYACTTTHTPNCCGKYCGICDCGATDRQAKEIGEWLGRRIHAGWPRQIKTWGKDGNRTRGTSE